jgi:type III pantothenate kinase
LRFAYAAVGSDRKWNLLEARDRCKGAFVVLDFGSAICVDFVNEKSQHLGGWILPGRRLMLESLFSGTAKLPHVKSGRALSLGKTTSQSIEAGAFAHLRAILLEAKSSAAQQFKSRRFRIFVTGGDSRFLVSKSRFDPYMGLQALKKWNEE